MGKDKRDGYGLEIKTFIGRSENSYIVFKSLDGSFHVFQEIDAKSAAKDCLDSNLHNNANGNEKNTRQMWGTLWAES